MEKILDSKNVKNLVDFGAVYGVKNCSEATFCYQKKNFAIKKFFAIKKIYIFAYINCNYLYIDYNLIILEKFVIMAGISNHTIADFIEKKN